MIHSFEIIVTNYEIIPLYIKKSVLQILRNPSKYKLNLSYGEDHLGGSSQTIHKKFTESTTTMNYKIHK